jgi:hypothetical protein
MVSGPTTDALKLHSLIKGAALGHTQTAAIALYKFDGSCTIMRTTAMLDKWGGLMEDEDVCRLVMTRAETGENKTRHTRSSCDFTRLPNDVSSTLQNDDTHTLSRVWHGKSSMAKMRVSS